MNTIATAQEIDGLKTRLNETWMAGDYDRFSCSMEKRRAILLRGRGRAASFGLWGFNASSSRPALERSREITGG
jgi:hypothetical protein